MLGKFLSEFYFREFEMAFKIEMVRCFCAVVEQGNLNDAHAVGAHPFGGCSMMLKQFEEHVGAGPVRDGAKARLTLGGGTIDL